ISENFPAAPQSRAMPCPALQDSASGVSERLPRFVHLGPQTTSLVLQPTQESVRRLSPVPVVQGPIAAALPTDRPSAAPRLPEVIVAARRLSLPVRLPHSWPRLLACHQQSPAALRPKEWL